MTDQLDGWKVYNGNGGGNVPSTSGETIFKSELVTLCQSPVWILLLRSKTDHNFWGGVYIFGSFNLNSQSVHTNLLHFKQ